jgi:hypothetical protein
MENVIFIFHENVIYGKCNLFFFMKLVFMENVLFMKIEKWKINVDCDHNWKSVIPIYFSGYLIKKILDYLGYRGRNTISCIYLLYVNMLDIYRKIVSHWHLVYKFCSLLNTLLWLRKVIKAFFSLLWHVTVQSETYHDKSLWYHWSWWYGYIFCCVIYLESFFCI